MSTLELGDSASSGIESPSSGIEIPTSSQASVESVDNEGQDKNKQVVPAYWSVLHYVRVLSRVSGECWMRASMALMRWLGMTPQEQLEFDVNPEDRDIIVIPLKRAIKKKANKIKRLSTPKAKKNERNNAKNARNKKKVSPQNIETPVTESPEIPPPSSVDSPEE
ncbi:hypothetical protein KR084_004896 [Drosophila pseudotakahashii]|nr:hypothetical protein KR084_004896 [Drosophila pseudotakahashii]